MLDLTADFVQSHSHFAHRPLKIALTEVLFEGGEDFPFYAEKVPGVFFRTGCHVKGEPIYSTHSEYMIVDPACFPIGMQVMVESALNYLAQNV